jgi:hypothetical protein
MNMSSSTKGTSSILDMKDLMSGMSRFGKVDMQKLQELQMIQLKGITDKEFDSSTLPFVPMVKITIQDTAGKKLFRYLTSFEAKSGTTGFKEFILSTGSSSNSLSAKSISSLKENDKNQNLAQYFWDISQLLPDGEYNLQIEFFNFTKEAFNFGSIENQSFNTEVKVYLS